MMDRAYIALQGWWSAALAWASQLDPIVSAQYASATILGAFALRTIYILLGRLLGIYSPAQYRWFPRLPWRPVVKAWCAMRGWWERVRLLGKYGPTGGFASLLETLTLMFKPGLFHIGRAYGFGLPMLQGIGLPIQRHGVYVAQTGAGKSTGLTLSLSLWSGSAYLVDAKGKIVDALAGKDWRQWLIFDPDGTTHFPSISINFFDCIRWAVEKFGEGAAVLWAMRMAEALIVVPPDGKSAFFYETPKQFLAGLILHILSVHPEEECNLVFMRQLILHGYEHTGDPDSDESPHQLLLRVMLSNPAFNGAIAGAAAAMASADGETLSSLRATLLKETGWLDIPNVQAVLQHSDICLADLKARDDIVLAFAASIYSIREELRPLTRVLTNMLAYTFEAERSKKGQCLWVLDEFPSMGHNGTIEVALAVLRSHGVSLIVVTQSLELLRLHYPKSFKSFVGEADFVLWMGGNHPDNAAYLKERLGACVVLERDKQSGRKTYREISVMDQEQIARFLDPNSHRLIATRAGRRALKLVNDPYYLGLPVFCYAPDPDHREALFRRLTRCVLWLPAKVFSRPSPMETSDDT